MSRVGGRLRFGCGVGDGAGGLVDGGVDLSPDDEVGAFAEGPLAVAVDGRSGWFEAEVGKGGFVAINDFLGLKYM